MISGGRTGRLAGGTAGRAAAALICIAAVAGCSSSPSSSAPPATSAPASSAAAPVSSSAPATATAPASSPAAPAGCATSSLRVSQGPPEGYAGGTDTSIDFTNSSGASCTLYGYPGVSLVSAPPYAQIGLAAKRTTGTPVKLITLAPGATGQAVLQIVDALNFPTATCGPVKAAYLRVYPPNQTVPVYLANTSQACSKPVQILTIGPVQAGSAG